MTVRSVFALFVLLAGIPLAYAKGSPALILISGGGLPQAIEITDPASLQAFDPWLGQFADWQKQPLVDAPCFRRSFEVLFYMKWPGRKSALDRGDLAMIYATRYCFDGTTGYVYLPEPSEPLYRQNAGTMLRGRADGKWFPSTPAWDSLLANAVAIRDQQATTDMILISGGPLKHPIEITDSDLLTTFDPWVGPFVDWEQPASMGHCNWEYEVEYFKRGLEVPTTYDHDSLGLIYGLRYCAGDDGHPGYVNLAGRDDKFGPENVRTIWDGTQAGKWHASTQLWTAFIEREVASQRRVEGASTD